MKYLSVIALALAFVLAPQAFANSAKAKKKASGKFTVKIENISNADGLMNPGGAKYPFALSPGMWAVNGKEASFFKVGKKADAGIEAQAEDGNPEVLMKMLSVKFAGRTGIFNMPVGANMPAPILPGGVYEFSFEAEEGMKLWFVTMYGQSNDLFYAPAKAFDLFANGQPLSGDITDKLMLWDGGTEVNQEPGVGDQQAPRQKAANTGTAENGVVRLLSGDGFIYPNTKDVLRVTIAPAN